MHIHLIRLFFITLLQILITAHLSGQQDYVYFEKNNISNSRCFQLGDSLSLLKEYDQAITFFNSCLKECKLKSDSLLLYKEIAFQHFLKEELKLTQRYLDSINAVMLNHDEFLPLQYSMSQLFKMRFIIERALGDYRQALVYIRKSLACVKNLERSEVAQAHFLKDKGITHWRLNELDSALLMIQHSMSLIDGNVDQLSLNIENHQMLGLIYWEENDLSRALNYYKIVYNHYLLNDSKNHKNLFITCNNIGILKFDNHQYKEAIDYLSQGLDYLNQIKDSRIPNPTLEYYQYTLNSNISNAYYFLEEFDLARSYCFEAMRQCEESRGLYHPDLLYMINIYNDIKLGTGDLQKINELSKRGLNIAKSAFGGGSIKIVKQYNYMARNLLATGDYDLAKIYSDSALVGNIASTEVISKQKYSYDELYETINIKLEMLKDAGLQSQSELDDLYDIFSANYASVLFHLDSEYVRERIDHLINTFFDCYYALYRLSFTLNHIERLIEISEIKKSRELIRSIVMNDGKLNFLPEKIQKRERSLRDSITYMLNKEELTSSEETKVAQIKKEHYDLIDSISNERVMLGELLFQRIDFDIAELRIGLGVRDLSVFFFESTDSSYAIAVSRDQVKVASINFNDLFANPIEDNVQVLWDKLEIDPTLERIELFPDGRIWDMNFASLRPQSLGEADYLGLTSDIVYQYSYNFKKANRRKIKQKVANVLAIGYESKENRESLLPGAKREIELLKEIWGAKLESKHLTAATFKKSISKYSMVHLAVHSSLDTLDFQQSRVILGTDSLLKNDLYLSEINNLDISTDLIVLSSCMTGQGQLHPNEGVLSLGRAFSIAGAQSVLASRSNVLDDSAVQIMTSFHKYLKKGLRKSTALREARLEYLNSYSDNITSHPTYWANFYIIGNDDPVMQNNRGFSFLIVGISALLVVFLAFRGRGV